MAKHTEPKGPNWSKLHPWFKEAYDIAQRQGGYIAVANNTPAFEEWMKYFVNRMGKLPHFMQEATLKQPGYEVTLPTEWPPKEEPLWVKQPQRPKLVYGDHEDPLPLK